MGAKALGARHKIEVFGSLVSVRCLKVVCIITRFRRCLPGIGSPGFWGARWTRECWVQ